MSSFYGNIFLQLRKLREATQSFLSSNEFAVRKALQDIDHNERNTVLHRTNRHIHLGLGTQHFWGISAKNRQKQICFVNNRFFVIHLQMHFCGFFVLLHTISHVLTIFATTNSYECDPHTHNKLKCNNNEIHGCLQNFGWQVRSPSFVAPVFIQQCAGNSGQIQTTTRNWNLVADFGILN